MAGEIKGKKDIPRSNDSKESVKSIEKRKEVSSNKNTDNSGVIIDRRKLVYENNKIDGEKNRMQPPIIIKFKLPEGMDRKEFIRQLKGQERGLNSQTIAENTDNREAFEKRKAETGNGRDVEKAGHAQKETREKALQSRIENNQSNGMSYKEAKTEAESWIKTQAAIHNPDQIAGGSPEKVSRMGDSRVNSSIGGQWKSRVDILAQGVEDYSKGKTRAELENTKMNIKLEIE